MAWQSSQILQKCPFVNNFPRQFLLSER
jgi:hypothetical protein